MGRPRKTPVSTEVVSIEARRSSANTLAATEFNPKPVMGRPRKATIVVLDPTGDDGLPAQALDEDQLSNGAEGVIKLQVPYIATVTIEGTSSLLFHAYNPESVAAKTAAPKGSSAKKVENLDTYAHKTDDGHLGIPGVAFAAAIANAGRSKQDPRSPRKSMRELLLATVIPLEEVFPFTPTTKKWDYEDARRAVVQRSAITRIRPAMRAGWRATFTLLVNAPEYVSPQVLLDLITASGKFVGLLDFRPTFGRYHVVNFEVQAE